MLDQLLDLLPFRQEKTRDLAAAAAGMGALLMGRKLIGLGLFARGVKGLEEGWRARNPDVEPTLQARLDRASAFYEETHQNETNRLLHRVGIPMIVGGAAGLLLFRPYRPLWAVSATAFAGGWALNLVGHKIEGKAPAFAEDPLSFLIGPLWDLQQMKKKKGDTAQVTTQGPNDGAAAGTGITYDVETRTIV